jgi:hypothetical protein
MIGSTPQQGRSIAFQYWSIAICRTAAAWEAQAVAKEATTDLLALPWELLHDGRSYLFQGQHAVRVRRRLPNWYAQPHAVTGLPIRILLVSPRPENAHTGYIDHCISVLPLVEAMESLGTWLNSPCSPRRLFQHCNRLYNAPLQQGNL